MVFLAGTGLRSNEAREASREMPAATDRFVWAERESNPHSQRRLIYSQRQAHGKREADFLAIPTPSFTPGVHFREESVAHFIQHGAGRLTR